MLSQIIEGLVRPTWLEGKLSNDAHNVIVKETVNEDMGIMKQLPSTLDGHIKLFQGVRNELTH